MWNRSKTLAFGMALTLAISAVTVSAETYIMEPPSEVSTEKLEKQLELLSCISFDEVELYSTAFDEIAKLIPTLEPERSPGAEDTSSRYGANLGSKPNEPEFCLRLSRSLRRRMRKSGIDTLSEGTRQTSSVRIGVSKQGDGKWTYYVALKLFDYADDEESYQGEEYDAWNRWLAVESESDVDVHSLVKKVVSSAEKVTDRFIATWHKTHKDPPASILRQAEERVRPALAQHNIAAEPKYVEIPYPQDMPRYIFFSVPGTTHIVAVGKDAKIRSTMEMQRNNRVVSLVPFMSRLYRVRSERDADYFMAVCYALAKARFPTLTVAPNWNTTTATDKGGWRVKTSLGYSQYRTPEMYNPDSDLNIYLDLHFDANGMLQTPPSTYKVEVQDDRILRAMGGSPDFRMAERAEPSEFYEPPREVILLATKKLEPLLVQYNIQVTPVLVKMPFVRDLKNFVFFVIPSSGPGFIFAATPQGQVQVNTTGQGPAPVTTFLQQLLTVRTKKQAVQYAQIHLALVRARRTDMKFGPVSKPDARESGGKIQVKARMKVLSASDPKDAGKRAFAVDLQFGPDGKMERPPSTFSFVK